MWDSLINLLRFSGFGIFSPLRHPPAVTKVSQYRQFAPVILRACIGMAMGSITAAIMTADIVNIATQFDTDQSDIGIVGCATIPLAKARLVRSGDWSRSALPRKIKD
jgi:hypothetical protein